MFSNIALERSSTDRSLAGDGCGDSSENGFCGLNISGRSLFR
ncbi:hypothetical protein [Tolypothrix sp. FACHB-123]|nr:hypothetical protein [Tolypothrix sp. FACHB-123]